MEIGRYREFVERIIEWVFYLNAIALKSRTLGGATSPILTVATLPRLHPFGSSNRMIKVDP